MQNPEVMQLNQQQLEDIIQWDVKSWSKAIGFWESRVDWSHVKICLELGGREGGLSLWLALKGNKVICSDLEATENSAKPLHEKYDVLHRIRYEDIDATEIFYENYFDIIVFKSIIGGIGRDGHPELQRKVFSQIHKALKPGGQLLFAENLMASPLHQQLRKAFVRWGNTWRYLSLADLQSCLSDFSGFEIQSSGVLSAFGRSEVQRNFLSRIDNAVMNKISPVSWNYIGYGVATK